MIFKPAPTPHFSDLARRDDRRRSVEKFALGLLCGLLIGFLLLALSGCAPAASTPAVGTTQPLTAQQQAIRDLAMTQQSFTFAVKEATDLRAARLIPDKAWVDIQLSAKLGQDALDAAQAAAVIDDLPTLLSAVDKAKTLVLDLIAKTPAIGATAKPAPATHAP